MDNTGAGGVDGETRKNILKAQQDLLKRLPLGSKMLTKAAEEHLRAKVHFIVGVRVCVCSAS